MTKKLIEDNASAPPLYENEWKIVEHKDIKEIEHIQICELKNTIEHLLKLEFSNNFNNADLIGDIDIDLKYKQLKISIHRRHKKRLTDYMPFIYNIINALHPIKLLGMAYIYINYY